MLGNLAISRSKIYCFIGIVFLLSDAVSGPLRYYTNSIGLEVIVYLPKLLAFMAFVFAWFFLAQQVIVWFVLAFLFFSSGVAVSNGVSLSSILFAIFSLSPLFLGLVTPIERDKYLRVFLISFSLIWFVTIFGIFLDFFVYLPWEGSEMDIFGTTVENSRAWSTMGFERPAGFARLSAAAAFYSGAMGCFLFFLIKDRWLRVCILFFTIVAVVLTTNKAAIGGVVVIILVSMVYNFKWLQRGLVASIVLVSVYLPFSTIGNQYSIDLKSEVDVFLLASFEMRLIETWPNYFDALGLPSIGEGLGGVGSSFKNFNTNPNKENLYVSDNSVFYNVGLFGVYLGVLLYIFFSLKVARLLEGGGEGRALGMVGLFILSCAVTTDMLEAPVASYFIGLLIKYRLGVHK